MTSDAQTDRNLTAMRSLDFAWLELSNRCNLECTHCYAASSPRESVRGSMSLDEWFEVLQDLRLLGCRAVQLIGGEPTIYPDFKDIVSEAHALKFEVIEVYTNATRLSLEMCEFLRNHEVKIAFSFYSRRPEIHDAITTRKGSWKRTINGISNAVAVGLNVRAGVIETPHNSGETETSIEFLNNLGIYDISIDRQREFGRAGAVDADFKLNELCGKCGDRSISIDSTGAISPCVFSHKMPIGLVKDGVSEAIDSLALRDFRNDLASSINVSCSPRCNPHDCNPADGGGPCFPSGCDPQMCNPISCPPRDITSIFESEITQSCSPHDRCSPRACSPQIGGPPGCTPHQICAPTNFPCVPRG